METPEDLFSKLKWELEKFREDPANPWLAFNFFVTAEHLPDWIKEKSLRKNEAILRVCSHLANGGKHFEVNRHSSVSSTAKDGVYEDGLFEKEVYEEWLKISLEPKEANALGYNEINAVPLAENIVKWWEDYFSNKRHDQNAT